MAKQRTTMQRKIILEAVKNNKHHPTADDIYVAVYQKNPKISRGTVYRNLNLLSENGEISHVSLADGADCFDYRTDPHYHFRCQECGGVWDVELPYMSDLEKQISKNTGFALLGHHLIFDGVCKKCGKKRSAH